MTVFSDAVSKVAYLVRARPPAAVPVVLGARSKRPDTNIRVCPSRKPPAWSIHPVTPPAASTVKLPLLFGASSTTLPALPVNAKRMSMPRSVGVISARVPLSRVTP